MATPSIIKCPKCCNEAARITVLGVPPKYVFGPAFILCAFGYFAAPLYDGDPILNDGDPIAITLFLATGVASFFAGVALSFEKSTWRCKQCGNKFKT